MRTVRCLLPVLAIVLAVALPAQAQTPVTIDDLTAPTSPAFVLLDTTPASVARPETPKAFTVNLLNSLATSNGLPQNYAIEVAPYWMASHPALTFRQYQHPGVWQSLAQTFSVSVATVPLEATGAATQDGTRLGLGVRTSLVNGSPNPTLTALVDDLHQIDDEILDTINAGRPVPEELRARARQAAAAIQAADAERIGFFVVLAAGQAWAVPGDDLTQQRVERRAFWVTPSYRFRACTVAGSCESMLDVVGVVRGLQDPDRGWAWDYGGRLVWRPTRLIHLSVESLQRTEASRTPVGGIAGGSSRTAGILEYRIRQDLVFYASFGRDFRNDAGAEPLVSMLGLNVGFGAKPTVRTDGPDR
jgi:hypothetical protein